MDNELSLLLTGSIQAKLQYLTSRCFSNTCPFENLCSQKTTKDVKQHLWETCYLQRDPISSFETVLDGATAVRLNDWGRWGVCERQHILPPDMMRNKSPALWAQGRLGWGARGLRWKRRWSWVISSISAPQSTGAVNLNSYITGPLKTSIAGYSRHIRVTLEKLDSVWGRGWFRHQENVLRFPLITSSGLGVLF